MTLMRDKQDHEAVVIQCRHDALDTLGEELVDVRGALGQGHDYAPAGSGDDADQSQNLLQKEAIIFSDVIHEKCLCRIKFVSDFEAGDLEFRLDLRFRWHHVSLFLFELGFVDENAVSVHEHCIKVYFRPLPDH